jgi:type II secretory pathway pseudopilin PulG
MLVASFRKDSGDTLIEVLFATAVFSLIAVGGLALMNQGTAASQRALEITLVRNEIDSQAEALRFLNASYIAAYQIGVSDYAVNTPAGQWQLMHNSIVASGLSSASPFGATGSTTCPSSPQGSFIIDTRNATFVSPSSGNMGLAQTFSKVIYDAGGNLTSAAGIWIEAVRSISVNDNNQAGIGYIDFHIRACWDSPGQSVPATIGTIVRLYEPRG